MAECLVKSLFIIPLKQTKENNLGHCFAQATLDAINFEFAPESYWPETVLRTPGRIREIYGSIAKGF